MDLLRDSLTPHSLQNPPPSPYDDDDNNNNVATINNNNLTQQEAAHALFSSSEILAPMVRASTTPLRTLALSHGATLVYSEEMIDRSIFHTERILNEKLGTIDYVQPKHSFSKKVQKRMETNEGKILLRLDPLKEKGRFIYQMGTGEVNLALEAAEKVFRDVDGLDVNMGCPKKFSVSGGMGSALLSDPKRACDILSTLSRNIPQKPISAKIRLLHPTDPRPTIDFAKSLIKSGANAIAIHGRIVGDEAQIPARWETLVEVVRELKQTENVPIIVNGDLYTRKDIRELKRRSGCDGIMLARPALYNVSLFRRGDDNLQTGEVDGEDDDDSMDIPLSKFQQQYHQGYYGYNSPLLHPQSSIIQEYISHCVRYNTHPKNAKYVVCEMMNTRRTPTERVTFLNMNNFPGKQTINDVCKCRTLEDLVKVWDVKWTIPLPTSNVFAGGEYVAGVASENVAVDSSSATRNNSLSEVQSGEVASLKGSNEDNGEEVMGDLHNYDDRYFLDPDKFRKERIGAVDAAISAGVESKSTHPGKGDEKKESDVSDPEPGYATKRPKL